MWVAMVFGPVEFLLRFFFLLRFATSLFFFGRLALAEEGIKRIFPGRSERGFLMRLKSFIARIVVPY